MIVIETCPECGGDLEHSVYTTNPPIPAWRCLRCGWRYEQKPDWRVVRVPFCPPKEES